MITDELVSFETAKLAKEKGFDVPTDRYYHIYDDIVDAENSLEMTGDGCADFYNSLNTYRCAAPTQSLLQRWLREEKGIVILINIGYCYENKDTPFYENPNMEPIFNGYYYGIWMLDDLNDNLGRSNYFPTYELALEDALKYALENLIV